MLLTFDGQNDALAAEAMRAAPALGGAVVWGVTGWSFGYRVLPGVGHPAAPDRKPALSGDLRSAAVGGQLVPGRDNEQPLPGAEPGQRL